jgi:alkaline phosphatase D
LDKAIKDMNQTQKDLPGDLESLYVLAVASAQKGDLDQAFVYTQKAIDGGLPIERFLAGPRDLLQPFTESEPFKKLARQHNVQLLHGPLLGCVTDSGAKFWVRTVEEIPIQILVSKEENLKSAMKSPAVKTAKDKDYTAIAAVTGLNPNTQYYYQLVIDNQKQPRVYSFTTFPAASTKAKFQVGFGGGAGFTPQYEYMWNTINAHKPIAFLFLGDNVYIDNPTRPAVQKYCYYRRQARPEYRNFSAATSIFSIWDDHDFTINDGRGGPEINEPKWKIPVWHVYRQNWNNPSYGGNSETQPGCWYDFSIGDVHFIMLDCRYYRENPRSKNPSMLGPVQKKWFLETLKYSKGTFKVLASSVPWAKGTKPGSRDTWDGYDTERQEILDCIQKNIINGVVLLSADRHRSDIWKIEQPNGYDIYEFESSRLTNIHTHGAIKGNLFSYNKKCSFGLLDFDTTQPDPQVTYKIINIDDELIHTFSLKLSQLSF